MQRVLEAIANLSITVASIALCVAVFVYVKAGSPQPPASPQGYAIGDKLAAIPGVALDTRDQTLLMYVRSDCRYCTESLPFYRSLAAAQAKQAAGIAMIAITDEPAAQCEQYLMGAGVKVDGVVTIKPGSLRVTGTPTLLLVDKHGAVLRQWLGRLPESGEIEVRKALALD